MTRAVFAFLLITACAGEAGVKPCEPPRALQLELTYSSGDCLLPGLTETLVFEVIQQGDTFTAYERGEPADSTIWQPDNCRLLVETSFYYAETETTWEIEGRVTWQIELAESPPGGFGTLDATIYPQGVAESCSQIIRINE